MTKTATPPAQDASAPVRAFWSKGDYSQIAMFTGVTAARLVREAGVTKGQHVLDVGTGTGVVAVTAARAGARVVGIDPTPTLLDHARISAELARVDVELREGGAPDLAFEDDSFDVVLSQFAHLFAPDPERTAREMLRVLRPGGTLAFVTIPPWSFLGRSFAVSGRFLPPPPGVPPTLWGEPSVVQERLGPKVKDVRFTVGSTTIPATSGAQFAGWTERYSPPFAAAAEALAGDPAKLAEFRAAHAALAEEFLIDNEVRHDFLLTRATKR